MLTFRKIGIVNSLFLILIAIYGMHSWYFLMLTVAQLIFVPLTLHLIMKNEQGWFSRYLPYISLPALLSVVVLQMTNETSWDILFAFIYFLFTFVVAAYGFIRFLTRGFIHLEEFLIDIGLIYLAIGGAWFLAYEGSIDTGFSPILTWLTGIHFHYSAFLLPVFMGFLGRLYKSRLYHWLGAIVIISPIVVALGITFSPALELLSVILYMVGIYGLIYVSLKANFHYAIQKWFIRISFVALGVSIIFSLLYALGNMSGLFYVSIDFMLIFHGITNCICFGLLGVIGWSIHCPTTNWKRSQFPISKIRGKGIIGEKVLVGKSRKGTYTGLVDEMAIYNPDINPNKVSPTIIDFYENTIDYRLFAKVKWCMWFKPFAAIYRLISRITEQLNLPFSSGQVEMTGDIIPIKDELDGRTAVRAWIRKTNGKTTFVALYSSHTVNGKTYMNISLPLPFSTMVGVLELQQEGKDLRLSSKKSYPEADSGIYLAMKNFLFKLPLEERFHVKEVGEGMLVAKHVMWIFSVRFLEIDYVIRRRGKSD